MKLDQLIAKVGRKAPLCGSLDSAERESSKRRRSLMLARELRTHGLLHIENEGAAPNSWWTPGGRQ